MSLFMMELKNGIQQDNMKKNTPFLLFINTWEKYKRNDAVILLKLLMGPSFNLAVLLLLLYWDLAHLLLF